jgi:hypothetical protein
VDAVFKLRNVKVLPFAGPAPIIKGGEESKDGEARPYKIGVGSMWAYREPVGPTGNMVKA